MSETGLGLFLIIGSFAILLLGRVIEPMLARGYSRKYPDKDVARYMRGQVRYKRTYAAIVFALGTALLIYGLFGGRLPGK